MKLFITLLFFYFVFIPSVAAHCGTCSAGEKKECSVCKEGEHGKSHCDKRKGKDGKKGCAACSNKKENDDSAKATTDSGETNKAPSAAEGSKAPAASPTATPAASPTAAPKATPPPAERKKK